MKPTKSVHVLHDRAENSREEHYQLMKKIHNVAFFGFADAKPDSPLYKEAFEVAKVLASQGMTIVDGGGPGVMDAATKGAQAVRGETIAVTFYPQDAPGFEGRYVGNIAGTEIITQNYIERMFKLMEHGDAYVIFNGGTGTISELGTAWVMARLYFGHHKPFVLYGAFWLFRNWKARSSEGVMNANGSVTARWVRYWNTHGMDRTLLAINAINSHRGIFSFQALSETLANNASTVYSSTKNSTPKPIWLNTSVTPSQAKTSAWRD